LISNGIPYCCYGPCVHDWDCRGDYGYCCNSDPSGGKCVEDKTPQTCPGAPVVQQNILNYMISSDGKIIIDKENLLNKNYQIMSLNNIYNNIDFIVDENFYLNLGYDHEILANNANFVRAAGTMLLDKNGNVIELTNKSGHYKPTIQEAFKYKQLLQNYGIDLSNTKIILDEYK
jgi:hypothetical protein